MIIRFIVLLLFVCFPSTVFKTIIAIIINSSKRMIVWFFPHVGEEIVKDTPALAYPNPASAIMAIGRQSRIYASANHATPYLICRGVAHSMSFNSGAQQLLLQTTARMNMANTKGTSLNNMKGTAVATTQPSYFLAFTVGARLNSRQNDKPTKSKTGHVYGFHSDNCITPVYI